MKKNKIERGVLGRMIYYLSTGVLVPGKMGEFFEIATKELMPLYPKLGMKLAGSFKAYSILHSR